MNNLIKSYSESETRRKRGPSESKTNKKPEFKTYTCNLKRSLKETEYFLNNIQELSKYIRLCKLFR